MGADVSVLSNHNLDLSSLENLATDLSERLNVTVEFEYYAIAEYNALLENNLPENYISEGRILKNEKKLMLKLIDENFQFKQLYKKFGDELYKQKDLFYWSKHFIDEYEYEDEDKNNNEEEKIAYIKKQLQFADYAVYNQSKNNDSGYMNIYNETINISLFYYSRWWSFYRYILEKNYFDNDDFFKYIYSNLATSGKLGGTKIYFLNDQESNLEGIGQGSEDEFTWNEVEMFLNQTSKVDLL